MHDSVHDYDVYPSCDEKQQPHLLALLQLVLCGFEASQSGSKHVEHSSEMRMGNGLRMQYTLSTFVVGVVMILAGPRTRTLAFIELVSEQHLEGITTCRMKPDS